MKPTLKPCPFCAGTDVEAMMGESNAEGNIRAFVACATCKATGPHATADSVNIGELQGMVKAVEWQWNNRKEAQDASQ